MDPNNNQPINTNPLGQTVAQPVQQPTPVVAAPPTPTPMPQTPKAGSKKGLILIVILLILIVVAISYVLFAKKQMTNTQKAATENTSTVIPTTIPTATPATVDEVIVDNPATDLQEIEKDVQGL